MESISQAPNLRALRDLDEHVNKNDDELDGEPLFVSKNEVLDVEPTFECTTNSESPIEPDTTSNSEENDVDDEELFGKDIDYDEDKLSYNALLEHLQENLDGDASSLWEVEAIKDHRFVESG